MSGRMIKLPVILLISVMFMRLWPSLCYPMHLRVIMFVYLPTDKLVVGKVIGLLLGVKYNGTYTFSDVISYQTYCIATF